MRRWGGLSLLSAAAVTAVIIGAAAGLVLGAVVVCVVFFGATHFRTNGEKVREALEGRVAEEAGKEWKHKQ